MVQFGSNLDPDEEFDDDLLRILDFPMECLEGDGLEGDWDISNSQCLGPIPSDVLTGLPTIRNDKINTRPRHLFLGPVPPIAGAPEQKQLSNHGGESSSHIRQQSNFTNVQESGAFDTQSPISVLESSGSGLGEKSLSIKSANPIPVRSRSKRVRPAGVNPWLLASPGLSTSQKTINERRSKESKKKLFQQPAANLEMDFMKDPSKKVEDSLAILDRAQLQNASSHRPALIKRCAHCEVTKTPQWREGPLGPKTLCNACGVRYRTGRLFPEYRPAASPTFVPSQHSNSHKRVIEMRKKAKQPAAKIKIAGAPEQKQLSNNVGESSSHIRQQNKFANVQGWSGAFETQSPVSVLESSGSSLGWKRLSTKSYNAIPVQSRLKRVRPAGVNTWLLASPGFSTSQKTLNARRSKGSKKKLFQRPVGMDFIKDPAKNVESSLAVSDREHLQNASSHHPVIVKRCAHCESTKTPQWREGLCNDCEVRYRTGRPYPEYRPAASPALLASSHKFIKMRNKAKEPEAKNEEPPPSPLCRSKESKKKLLPRPVAMDSMEGPPKKVENPLAVPDRAHPQNASSHRPAIARKCSHCQTTKTPQWREGPLGKTLCNACGVRYRTGRLFPEYRPAASPTFVPSQHSNSHKKVIEMRSRAKQPEAKNEVLPTVPQL